MRITESFTRYQTWRISIADYYIYLSFVLKALISIGLKADYFEDQFEDEERTLDLHLVNFETDEWVPMKNFPAFPADEQSEVGTVVVNGVLYVAGGSRSKYDCRL